MSDNKEQMKQWIDKASYIELLRKYRYAPAGDPFFQGEIGDYYCEVMSKKRKEVGNEEHTRASKAIDWA